MLVVLIGVLLISSATTAHAVEAQHDGPGAQLKRVLWRDPVPIADFEPPFPPAKTPLLPSLT